MQKLQLPNRFIDLLINLPENGMGYQIVNVFLRNGHILRQHKVLNSSLLLLEENEKVDSSEIERIELQKGTLK